MVRGRVCGGQVVQGPRWLGLRCPVTLAKKSYWLKQVNELLILASDPLLYCVLVLA